MFKEPVKSTAWPVLPAVIAYVETDDGCYYATDANGVNGAIHPCWVIAAWCLEQGWSEQIVVNGQVPLAWVTAFNGLSHLGWSAQGVRLTLKQQQPGPKPLVLPAPEGSLYRVDVDGAAPANDGQVLTAGNLFTPNAHGFFNLPRLYAMAALLMEHRTGAAVAALVTNASGFIIAKGSKSYGDVGCGHAEVKAILSILGQLPASGAIFTTLKPCTMCAGLLHATTGANFRKYWARNDPNNGADWSKVANLTLLSAISLSATAQTNQNIRSIKLSDGKSFTDEFSVAWTHRADAYTKKDDRMAEAFVVWRDKNVVAGRMLVAQKVRVVANKDGTATVEARVKNIGTITALSARADLFQRCVSGVWKDGVDEAAKKAITDAFTKSADASKVNKAAEAGSKAQDMGIIKFISEHSKSTSLSTASHRALAAKFAKYGKSSDDIEQVTGVKGATPSSTKVPDVAVQQVVDYLYGFLRTT